MLSDKPDHTLYRDHQQDNRFLSFFVPPPPSGTETPQHFVTVCFTTPWIPTSSTNWNIPHLQLKFFPTRQTAPAQCTSHKLRHIWIKQFSSTKHEVELNPEFCRKTKRHRSERFSREKTPKTNSTKNLPRVRESAASGGNTIWEHLSNAIHN